MSIYASRFSDNTPRRVSQAFTAAAQTSPTLDLNPGEMLVFEARGGDATLVLELLASDGTTWIPVSYPNTATVAQWSGAAVGVTSLVGLPGARYRVRSATWVSNKTAALSAG